MTLAAPLPYDMGNVGDLIKHGLIAEFCEWWLESHDGVFTFVDPFAGRPYVSPPHPEVSRRLLQLPACALKRAQKDPDVVYYGSGSVIKHSAHAMNRPATIKVSDRDESALLDLLHAGFERYTADQFDFRDSFSIINSSLVPGTASLLLLDPFDDFLPEYADTVIPELPEFINNGHVPVALFVLCEEWDNELGRNWRDIKARHLAPGRACLSLAVNKIFSSRVRGESRYHSEILLVLPDKFEDSNLQNLVKRLQSFGEQLGKVLGQTINFAGMRPAQ
jgi:hypothetical protein